MPWTIIVVYELLEYGMPEHLKEKLTDQILCPDFR